MEVLFSSSWQLQSLHLFLLDLDLDLGIFSSLLLLLLVLAVLVTLRSSDCSSRLRPTFCAWSPVFFQSGQLPKIAGCDFGVETTSRLAGSGRPLLRSTFSAQRGIVSSAIGGSGRGESHCQIRLVDLCIVLTMENTTNEATPLSVRRYVY